MTTLFQTFLPKMGVVVDNCIITKSLTNKKVLLRERKRHTVRRVASACYAALCDGGGQTWGTPPDMGYPPDMGSPQDMGYPPKTWGTPTPDMGYLRTWGTPNMGYPSEMGYPMDMRWGTPPQDLRWDTPPRPEMGYPPTQT